jgi:predicted Zn-dependent protease
MSKRGNDRGAFDYLTHVLEHGGRSIRLRKARAVYAARVGSSKEAREDLALINAGQKSGRNAISIETQILLAEGRAREAYDLDMSTAPQEPGDWLVRASVFEALAEDPKTTIPERKDLTQRALELRTKYAQEPDYDYDG